jgi:galactose mutarotase-like enzyme
MTVRFSDAWRVHGFQALILENRHLRVVVIPELGGKIWSIVSKRHDRELLWHNARMPMRHAHYGATYDDWFVGGWDEIFPNDYPVHVDGENYPDHGEVWSLPGKWKLLDENESAVSIEIEHQGIAVDTRFRKTLTLREHAAELHVRYEIVNGRSKPISAHWKLHPALPLKPGALLHLPPSKIIVDPDFAEASAPATWAWPLAPDVNGAIRDMRKLPDPDAGETWFFYATELSDGYCAVSYPQEGIGFGLQFDPSVLTSVWIFATFSGWRGFSTIILEPCTGYRARLEDAIAHGSVMTMQPGEELSTNVVMSVFEGDDPQFVTGEQAR